MIYASSNDSDRLSAQSDQSFFNPIDHRLFTEHLPKTDQIVQTCRLIWVYAHKVHCLTSQIIWTATSENNVLSFAQWDQILPCAHFVAKDAKLFRATMKTIQTAHSDMCAERRFRSAYSFAWSDLNTDNPLYTDTRYDDIIRYNDNFSGTKPSLKR